MDVTVVHAGTHLMERQLDPDGAGVLAATYAELGVESVTDAQTTRVIHGDDGLTMVLADGRTVTGQLLVVSCGIRPETSLAAAAGLEVGRGVVIDDQCRTSHPDVFAVGDCAEHRGIPYGLVGPAWEQADVVADLLSGVNEDAAYTGSRLVTRLKAAGIDLAAMGRIEGDEVVSFADPVRGTYARLVIDENGKLAGAVMLGDNPMVGQVVQLFDTGDPVPHDRRTLLMGRPGESVSVAPETPASMPDEAVVCRCNNVTKKELTDAFRGGARTPQALSDATQASTGCGTCVEDVAGSASGSARPSPDSERRPRFERGFSMSEKRLVVVGDGMVGRRFLEAVVERDPSWSVTVLSEEPRPAYDRVRLSAFFDGVSAEELSLASDLPGVDVRLGEPATAIDREAKVVRTESGTHPYDKLVLATGSYPFVPPMEGVDAEGVFVYRTIEDLEAIKAHAEGRRHGVVIGGGLLGLEAANALKLLGLETRIVEFAPWLMARQLDEAGGGILKQHIEKLGIDVACSTGGSKIEATGGRLRMETNRDGVAYDTDLIVFAAGVRPATSWRARPASRSASAAASSPT
ncbi:hypothetical protein GCM10029992_63380 [Glycomyces albus]